MLFIQCCIVGLTFFVWIISISKKEKPYGIIEWILTILSIIILIIWMFKY